MTSAYIFLPISWLPFYHIYPPFIFFFFWLIFHLQLLFFSLHPIHLFPSWMLISCLTLTLLPNRWPQATWLCVWHRHSSTSVSGVPQDRVHFGGGQAARRSRGICMRTWPPTSASALWYSRFVGYLPLSLFPSYPPARRFSHYLVMHSKRMFIDPLLL